MFTTKEGGIKVLAGLAPSSQTLGSLLRTPWLAKLARIFWEKVNLVNSLQLEFLLTWSLLLLLAGCTTIAFYVKLLVLKYLMNQFRDADK
jgi:hypothetical protein